MTNNKPKTNLFRQGVRSGRLGLLFAFVWIYTELCLHLLIFGAPDRRIIYPILFALAAAALCHLICAALPPVPQRAVGLGLTLLCVFWAEVQYIYQAIFGALLPLANLGLGGNVADFRSQLFYSIGHNLPQILALLVPLLVWILLLILRRFPGVRGNWKHLLASLGVILLSALATVGLMLAGRNQPVSVLRQLNSTYTTTTASYRSVGMAGTTLAELRFLIFPRSEEVPEEEPEDPGEIRQDPEDPGAEDLGWNVQDIDFEALAASTEDEELRSLDRIFAKTQPSRKNQYTGLLQDFNVVVFCAESFSPLIISEELTPTLYEMTHKGFVFQNFYGCFNSVTTNGEYTTCTGLFPDLSRRKTDSSFDAAVGHYLPYCLGNALRAQGYRTLAYHNYIGEFYNRTQTHTNMGYEFKSTSNGLEHVTSQWPASDLEMIVESVEDYVDEDRPFHAYYMTFSGHYQYDWQNAMSAKNRDRVKDLPYSETVKAYIACNLELEDALAALVDRLKTAGKLDRTLIVLTNDHYPYGLSPEEYSELAGHPVDTDFEKFRNSFICYTTALAEPVVVDDYCCTADILPTVLNLLGVPYDSRLLAGVDVLSDSEHVAILESGSFLTGNLRFNADTGEITVSSDNGAEISPGKVQRMQDLVTRRMELSRRILNTDYYSHVFSAQISDPEIASFEDVKEIYAQSSISWVINRGYMDPDSETVFGAERYCALGECLDCWYRAMGSPAVTADALPADYAARQNAPERLNEELPSGKYPPRTAFDESCPWYKAVCWAFEQGLLREDDRVTGHDDPINYLDCAVIIRRLCALSGVRTEIQPIPGDERSPADRCAECAAAFPEYSEEEIASMLWARDEKIINMSTDVMAQMRNSAKFVPRSRFASYLFRAFSYELEGSAEGGN